MPHLLENRVGLLPVSMITALRFTALSAETKAAQRSRIA